MGTRQDLIHELVAASCLGISLLYGLLGGRDAFAQVVTIPIRWCALEEAPSMQNPGVVNEETRKDVLWRRHERVTDNIFYPQCRINLRSGAIADLPDFVYLNEREGSLANWRGDDQGRTIRPRTVGLPGDVLLEETNLIWNKCSEMWHTKAPKVTGILAVHIRSFVRPDGTRPARGVAADTPIISHGGSQLDVGKVIVMDHAFLLPSSTLPPEPNRQDPFDKVLGHELGHALTLEHGNGVDNNGDGVIDGGKILRDGVVEPAVDERDLIQVFCTHDACRTEPFTDPRCQEQGCTPEDRRSTDNLMQYRFNPLPGPLFFPPDPRGFRTYGLVLTDGQCTRMREQAIKHIPDREITPAPLAVTIIEEPLSEAKPLANSAVDTLGDAAVAHADIDTFGIAVDPTLAVSYLVTRFGALFPRDLNGLQVFFLADTDNNPATGGDTRLMPGFPAGEGVDLAVRVGVDVTNGVAIPVATVFAATGDVEFPFRPLVDPRISAEVTTQTLVVDFEDPEERRDVAHGVTVTIPTELLPELGINARLHVVTQTAEGSPIDAATAVLTFETPEFPFCEVRPAAADRGERVVINAAGLPPVKEAHALLGTGAGDLIEVARAFTDGAGQVSLPFTVPQGVASGGRLVTVGLTDPNDARTADCVLTVGRRDTEPPVCALMEAVPKSHTTVIAQDTFSGLAAIKVLRAHNADVDIPDFTRGATGAVPVTATKIHPHLPAHVELEVVDVAGNHIRCHPQWLAFLEQWRDFER